MWKAVPPALWCRLLFTIYPRQKENQKYIKHDIFSVLCAPVWRSRPTKICMSVSQLYSKLRIMHNKWRFHDTPVQLVQNVHRSASCAIGQLLLYYSGLCPYSTKAKNIVKSTVSVLFPSLCTKDLEPRWFAKLSNCEQSLALSTTNKVSANHYSNVQNVHYWAWNTVVLPLV